MKTYLQILAILLLSVGCSSPKQNDKQADEYIPLEPIPLADPFILYDNGIYYMYGTGSENGIAVAVSEDLKTWEWPNNQKLYTALHKKDSYGNFWFWAPEVYKKGDKYLMYYSAEEHICAAESDSPLGPFRQVEKKPMREAKGIDNHLFIDDDGKPYLFWVHFGDGLQVWVAELEDDCKTIIPGTETMCLRTSQAWEQVWGPVNEGPFILKHEGTYYLSYSANSYESQDYGIGYATSKNPKGPWEKHYGNPILQKPGMLVGTGHHAFFKDKNGKGRIAFHSHNNGREIHPRIIHIGSYGFEDVKNGDDILYIEKIYHTPGMN